jgi:hypothetical protein
MNLIGQQVHSYHGTNRPEVSGVIYGHKGANIVLIRWDDGEREEINVHLIHQVGYRNSHGSQHGVFFSEVFQ